MPLSTGTYSTCCWPDGRRPGHSNLAPVAARGFTLIETALVLLLLSLLSGVGLFHLRLAAQRWRLSNSAQQLAAELRLARIRAISQGTNYRIQLRAGDTIYQRQRRKPDGYENDGPALQLGDGIVVAACSNPASAISFRPRGLAGEFGTVTLANQHNEQRRIVVVFTGEVRIE